MIILTLLSNFRWFVLRIWAIFRFRETFFFPSDWSISLLKFLLENSKVSDLQKIFYRHKILIFAILSAHRIQRWFFLLHRKNSVSWDLKWSVSLCQDRWINHCFPWSNTFSLLLGLWFSFGRFSFLLALLQGLSFVIFSL